MEKVTDQELQEITALRNVLVEIITTLGELGLREFSLSNELESVRKEMDAEKSKFMQFKRNEETVFTKLQEKYGTGQIDFVTGEIIKN